MIYKGQDKSKSTIIQTKIMNNNLIKILGTEKHSEKLICQKLTAPISQKEIECNLLY